MTLAEKIQQLRKSKQYSQEQLAELCSVSRQSISKWEADIALPEVDKLILLSKIFNVSIDVLLKDELSLDRIKEVGCSLNAVEESKDELYEGILIKESLADENALDYMSINKVELWRTKDKPKYWTALYFTSSEPDFPQIISQALYSSEAGLGNWFVDFKAGNTKYVVFHDKVLKYTIGNQEEKESVCAECRALGIPDEQMNWGE